MAALRELLAEFIVRVKGGEQLVRADRALNKLAVSAKGVDAQLTNTSAGLQKASASARRLNPATREAAAGTLTLSAAFQRLSVGLAAFAGARQITRLLDGYTTLQNRLKFVAENAQAAADAEKALFDISNATFTAVEDTTELFQRYTIATDSLGLSQDRVLNFTKRLTQATVLTAGSAAEAQGALVQLAQGIGTNFEAAGQELRSIQEQAPVLAGIIAKAAGGTSAQLLKLAKEGKINAELVVSAIEAAGDELDEAFLKRVPTVANGFTRIGNALLRFVGVIGTAGRANRDLAVFLGRTAEAIEGVIAPLELLFKQISIGQLAFSALLPLFSRFAHLLIPLGRALLRFLAPLLLVDDIITTLRGGDSVIARVLNTLLGVGATQKVVKSLHQTFALFFDFLFGESNRTADQMFVAFQAASEGIAEVFEGLGDHFKSIGEDFSEFFSLLWADIKDTAVAALRTIGQALAPIFPVISTASSLASAYLGTPQTAGNGNGNVTNNRTSADGDRNVTINLGTNAGAIGVARATSQVLEQDRASILAGGPS